jgi:hypothetical protein
MPSLSYSSFAGAVIKPAAGLNIAASVPCSCLSLILLLAFIMRDTGSDNARIRPQTAKEADNGRQRRQKGQRQGQETKGNQTRKRSESKESQTTNKQIEIGSGIQSPEKAGAASHYPVLTTTILAVFQCRNNIRRNPVSAPISLF